MNPEHPAWYPGGIEQASPSSTTRREVQQVWMATYAPNDGLQATSLSVPSDGDTRRH